MGDSKRWTNIIMYALIILTLILGGCGASQQTKIKKKIPKPPAGKNIRIAIALSAPGRGDHANNDEALAGLAKAKDELGIEYMVIDPGELVDEQESIRYLAENKYDLVIVVGAPMQKALNKVAPEYPDINFAIVDDVVNQPNVTSIDYREQEGSFLAGALAATITQSKTVGFIGGADLDLIHRYERGFKQGVNYINDNENKKVQILSNYLGLTVAALNDPKLGHDKADQQFAGGADIIYQAAGNSAQGIFDSAKTTNHQVIGSDINQNNIAPGIVYASMVKKVDQAVYQTIQKLIKGELKHGSVSFGLTEKGLVMEYAAGVPKDITDKINGIQDKIVKSEIKVSE